MKVCFKCNREKPLSEFYKHKMMGDGHLGKCKDCTKKYVTKHRRENEDYYKAYDSKRSKLPHRRRLRVKITKKRRKKVAFYMQAHNAVSRALRSGKLERMPCQMCGTKAWVQAHHDDYTKPLEVMWLCPTHHSARHVYLDYADEQ